MVIVEDVAGNEWKLPRTAIATDVQVKQGRRLLVTTQEREGKKPDRVTRV